MRIEFMCYVRDNIKEFAERGGYRINPEQHQILTNVINSFSNEDYESVSNELTNKIEKTLLSFGINKNSAIRYSWKWSD